MYLKSIEGQITSISPNGSTREEAVRLGVHRLSPMSQEPKPQSALALIRFQRRGTEHYRGDQPSAASDNSTNGAITACTRWMRDPAATRRNIEKTSSRGSSVESKLSIVSGTDLHGRRADGRLSPRSTDQACPAFARDASPQTAIVAKHSDSFANLHGERVLQTLRVGPLAHPRALSPASVTRALRARRREGNGRWPWWPRRPRREGARLGRLRQAAARAGRARTRRRIR